MWRSDSAVDLYQGDASVDHTGRTVPNRLLLIVNTEEQLDEISPLGLRFAGFHDRVLPWRGAGTLWYNGDADYRDAIANGIGAAPVPDALVYDNFNVTGNSAWTVTGAFSNDFMNYVGVTQAYWEIRTGVSDGDGGTLIASGTSSATQVDLGNSFFGLEEYAISVSGLHVMLAPGEYWLTVAPVSPPVADGDVNYSYIATTSGANAIGSPPGDDGNSFATSAGYGWNFTPTTDDSIEGPGTWDYSMGINGTVPEPASVTLLGIGGCALAGYVVLRRRLRRKSDV